MYLQYVLVKNPYTSTRGNSHKLQFSRSKYDVRKYFFTSRIVRIWNTQPDSVLEAESVNSFKNRLDLHWKDKELLYDCDAEIE